MLRALSIMILAATSNLLAQQTEDRYSGRDVGGIESIVRSVRNANEPWRKAANRRIDQHRKADLQIRVIDANGKPARNAEVKVQLQRHDFGFGCVVRSRLFNGTSRELTPIKSDVYKRTYLNFGFNVAGFDSALKPRQKDQAASQAERAMPWFAEHNIPVRGHTLMWPGWDRMHKSALRLKNNRTALKRHCEESVATGAKRWDVFEWDVVNEPRGKHDVQDQLGEKVLADWFRIAEKNVQNHGARLYLNENRVVSDTQPGPLTRNMRTYEATLKMLVDNGAPVSGLGFQSRFGKAIPPDVIYKRLEHFAKYDLPIAATEFEMKREVGNELQRAKLAEQVMTVYFSHPRVIEMLAWTLFPSDQDRNIVETNGKPNLRGKVWLFLTKQHWTTNETVRTDSNGTATVRGFLGEYSVDVTANGKAKTKSVTLNRAGEAVTLELR